MARKRSRTIFRPPRKRHRSIVKSVKARLLPMTHRTSCRGPVSLREETIAATAGLIACRQVPRHSLPIPHMIFCLVRTCVRRPGNATDGYDRCYARGKPYRNFAAPCFVDFFYDIPAREVAVRTISRDVFESFSHEGGICRKKPC